jgi:hypothetical protein
VHRCIQVNDLAVAIPDETTVLRVLNAADRRSGHTCQGLRRVGPSITAQTPILKGVES